MKRIRKIVLAALAAQALAPVSGLTDTPGDAPRAADLGWLAGRWCGVVDGVFNEEVWLAPRAGSLVGVHRDTAGGELKGFEFFRIVEEDGALVYWTQPGGAPALAFRTPANASPDRVVHFVNPEHDFPKRISYRRVDARTLHARIDDGTDAGTSMEWTWTLDCTAPPDDAPAASHGSQEERLTGREPATVFGGPGRQSRVPRPVLRRRDTNPVSISTAPT